MLKSPVRENGLPGAGRGWSGDWPSYRDGLNKLIMETYSAHINRVRESFPNLIISSVRANHEGLINDVLIVNEALVFRFPKNNTWAKALLDQEIRGMDVLRQYINMPYRSLNIGPMIS